MIERKIASQPHNPEAGQYGNCLQACYAALLNLPIERIPDFDNPEKYDDRARAVERDRFFASLNMGIVTMGVSGDSFGSLQYVPIYFSNLCGDLPYILTGKTASNVNHSIIMQSDRIVMNPSSSRISGPATDGFYWVEWVVPKMSHWEKKCHNLI